MAKVWYVDDDTWRYTAGLSGEYGTVSYSGSLGYAGTLNSMSAQIFYPLLERRFIPSLGASFAEYRLSQDAPMEQIFAGIVGSTVRPWQNFSFDFQLQWLNNRIMKRDVRLFAKMNLWFTEQLKLFW